MSPGSSSDAGRPDIVITHTEAGGKGRYAARVGDAAERAELTYVRIDAGTIVADHTWVPDALRGRGIGQVLVERLVEDARGGGHRIVPRCPYVRSLFGRHPEWSDVLEPSENQQETDRCNSE
jgi:predicted GNAT family acetyltransferase